MTGTDTVTYRYYLVNTLAPPPLNLRLMAIRPDYRDVLTPQAENLSFSRQAGRSTGWAQVHFAWEYRDIVGEAITGNTFRIDNPDHSFVADALKGYYLTFA